MAAVTTDRPGTKAQVRYARMSASKARAVLDLIRNKHVVEASQILAFSERLAAEVIAKCLRSAVANAGHNDDIPVDELFISACYADEGPTLKRYRPRARGRAGRIRKQTCHITIVVSRYSDEDLDQLRQRTDARSAGGGRSADAAADRRRRVAKSRQAQSGGDTASDTGADLDDRADSEVDDSEIQDAVMDESAGTGSTGGTTSPLGSVDDDTTTDTVTDETEEEN
jgi:large subunit ribosomal protein L22